MKRTAAIAICFCALAVGSEPEATLEWDHEGYAALPAAAKQAKRDGKRLLIGLAGSPT